MMKKERDKEKVNLIINLKVISRKYQTNVSMCKKK